MNIRSLLHSKLHTKYLIIMIKEKIINPHFLFVLLSIFLFPVLSNAQEESITVGTATRKMIVYAPSGIVPNRPLVLSLHGMNQTMYDQRNQTQFQSVAQANNFVLVFPQSNGTQWALWGTDDINFMLAIIDEMYKRYGIDRNRVYMSGFSMGGMMTYYAATQIADKIAAYAPVSGFLMSGPNTNSSRPIPIIHVHGADDGFVPYTNVQTHMDAWIARNGCPTTPVITKPYPADKPNSQSSKKYWGLGKEGVEIVFISVAGVGHWYSDDPNGVFTSQEIWNFCKKFSLKDGVPEFKYASVTDKNPKQIQVVLSTSITDSSHFKGFTVKIDNTAATIDSVVLCDTNKLVINLNESILKTNNITLSYSNGNVVSSNYKKKMPNFNDTLVDNLLKGSSPRIMEITTNQSGDTILAKFNKKMQIPSAISALSLTAGYNGQMSIPILPGSFFKNDSTILFFPLDKKVYRDYTLLLSYSGNNIVSADSGQLKTISDFAVTNNSNGLPVHLNSGKLENGTTLSLQFSKPMVFEKGQLDYFNFMVNGKNIKFTDFFVNKDTIKFTLSSSAHYQDTATISYTPGVIKASDNGPLEGISNLTITNKISVPTWISIPAKIEAENYSSQSGTQTENTSDTGGGLNVGWFDNGDWLEYPIENKTTKTDYQITFRVSAPGSGGIVGFYIDGKSAGQITVPNTGNWQTFQSVDANITISQGKHYFKVVAINAGFNLNYMNIHTPPALPVNIQSAKIKADGITLLLGFSKPMTLKSGQSGYFTFTIKGGSIAFKDYSVSSDTIKLTLSKAVHYGDTATISYTPGNITAADNGPLQAFSSFTVANQVGVPAWTEIPGKVEAENYTLKSGMQAETTNDVGGGQNLGNISNGDWAEYAVENNTSKTNYQIAFRVAAQSTGGIIDFYVDGKSAGKINVPNTGDLQVFQSVDTTINIGQGKHYLKVVATNAGFNLNYMEVPEVLTGIKEVTEPNMVIFPNPASNELIIRSINFHHNTVDIFDAMGNLLISKATAGESVLRVPVHLPNGMYLVKISNGLQYQFKKIEIANK